MKPIFEFGPDGAFTFFHITDVHEEDNPSTRPYEMLRAAIARRKPSLVIGTGDFTSWHNQKADFERYMKRLLDVLRQTRTPLCVTFGNHDSEHYGPEFWTRQEQYDLYRAWMGEALFVDHDVPALSGVGSGVVQIRRPGGTASAFNLFVMDSGAYSHVDPETGEKLEVPWGWGYDGCRADQIAWYERVSGDVPCLWFQHIIVPDANDTGLFVEAAEGESAVEMPVRGRKKRVKPVPGVVGEIKEATCPPPWEPYRDARHTFEGRTLYDSWRRTGNLRGAYFGHDQINSFDGTDRNGIRLGMTKALTVGCYNDGRPWLRSFTVRADGTFDTELLTDDLP